MVYKAEQPRMGITINIGTHRKHGNGAVGGGRKNSSGKKAIVAKDGEESVTLTGSTLKELMRTVRKQYNIPPSVRINESGETHI